MSKQNNPLIIKGEEHPEERIPLYKKGLDRPELGEKIKVFEERVRSNQNNCATCPPWKVDEARKQLLALIPDIEEAIIQARKEQMVIDWVQAGKDVEEAKKEMRERIIEALRTLGWDRAADHIEFFKIGKPFKG